MLRLIWDKAKDFITRAFTVIFIASLIIWFLQTFSITFNIVSDSKDSILALIGGVIAPIFAPLGFGDWRASTALITGFTAKESVVSTMTVLLGGSPVANMFDTHSAIVFLVFTLSYTRVLQPLLRLKENWVENGPLRGTLAVFCGMGGSLFGTWNRNASGMKILDKRILDRSVGVRSTKQFVGIKGGTFAPDIHI
mgnify:CR=1 FL=1